MTGDLVWSLPTLVTLPGGAPFAHVGLHIGAVTHDYRPGTAEHVPGEGGESSHRMVSTATRPLAPTIGVVRR
jgi:hypothetical protein